MNVSSPKKMEILIVFWPGLGNAMLLTPLLRSLKASFPSGCITLLYKEVVVKKLLESGHLVDEFIHYQKPEKPIAQFIAQIKLIYALRQTNYDVVIFTEFAQSKLTFLAPVIRADIKIGFNGGPWHQRLLQQAIEITPNRHETELYLALAEPLGAGAIIKAPQIVVTERDRAIAARLIPASNQPTIGIHPGCSDLLAHKRWPVARFAAVADALIQKYQARVVIFGGPTEVVLADQVKTAMKMGDVMVLAGQTSITEAAACIQHCHLFISNDSGLMHLAAGVGTPVVAVFGPTNPDKNSPVGNSNVVIFKNGYCPRNLNQLCDNCVTKKRQQSDFVPDCLAAVEPVDVLETARAIVK